MHTIPTTSYIVDLKRLQPIQFNLSYFTHPSISKGKRQKTPLKVGKKHIIPLLTIKQIPGSTSYIIMTVFFSNTCMLQYI